MKNKYNDNRLAEVADAIVLVRNTHKAEGYPSGSVGLLSKDYTGRGRGFEALFGERGELVLLKMNEFRVLCPDSKEDGKRIQKSRRIPLNAMGLCGAPLDKAVFL